MRRPFGLAAAAAVCGLAVLLAGCKSSTPAAGPTPGPSTTGQPAAPAKAIVVGFAQVGAESGWRTANTESIKSEAAKRGIDLKFADAQQKQENQIAAIRSFIAQGVNVIMFSPVVETGWDPVLQEAKRAHIPVILADRSIETNDESLYTTFIGADFIEEGKRAGDWLAKKMNGQAVIAELQGTPGSAPAVDRQKGFAEAIKAYPGMKIVWSQTGNFTRTEGKQAAEALLKSPEGQKINALFAHNDDMAIGAIQAIEAAGKKPGKDIIIVSVDGVRDAFKAMVDGKLNCSVECNPLLGPQLFDAAEALAAGKSVPKRIVTKEGVFPQEMAKDALPTRKY